MNFYNPYFYSSPIKGALGATKKLSFGTIINGTTKFLNLINQSIPIIKQTYPVIKNAKTMFSVLNEFKKSDSDNFEKENNEQIEQTNTKDNINNNYPTFFI